MGEKKNERKMKKQQTRREFKVDRTEERRSRFILFSALEEIMRGVRKTTKEKEQK